MPFAPIQLQLCDVRSSFSLWALTDISVRRESSGKRVFRSDASDEAQNMARKADVSKHSLALRSVGKETDISDPPRPPNPADDKSRTPIKPPGKVQTNFSSAGQARPRRLRSIPFALVWEALHRDASRTRTLSWAPAIESRAGRSGILWLSCIASMWSEVRRSLSMRLELEETRSTAEEAEVRRDVMRGKISL